MKNWTEHVRLAAPLKSVRLRPEPGAEPEVDLEQQLQARYEQGVRDGEKALREQLLQQRADLLNLQKGVLQSLQQTLPQLRSECEAALVELALEVAQKLVASLPITADMLEGAIREALGNVEDAHEILVRLNAEDLDLLQKVNAPVLLASVGGEKVHFEVSNEVTRGGCLVQTRFGMIDARRETKFELLAKSLRS
jgi:flagellar assembly protein FliH